MRVAGIAEGGFFHGKGVVEALYAALKAEPAFERAEDPLFHPGKTASHRRRASSASCIRACSRAPGAAFELDLEDLFAREPRSGHLPRRDHAIPAVRQDLAVVVAEDVEAGAIVAAAREPRREPSCADVRVFDVYRGEPVPAGRKSVAFSVAFQSPERTLTDEDAARLRGAIVDALAKRFGAELRA